MNAREKIQVDELMRQADFHITRFDKRRDYSWKIALAFWGAILGAATLLTGNSLNPCEIKIGGALVVALHGLWLVGVFKADQKDKRVAFQCRDASLIIINKSITSLGITINHPKPSFDRRFFEDWSALFQVITTLLLVIAIIRLVLH